MHGGLGGKPVCVMGRRGRPIGLRMWWRSVFGKISEAVKGTDLGQRREETSREAELDLRQGKFLGREKGGFLVEVSVAESWKVGAIGLVF